MRIKQGGGEEPSLNAADHDHSIKVSGSSKIQILLPSKLQNLKPCGEISITLDGNNVWILLEPHTWVKMSVLETCTDLAISIINQVRERNTLVIWTIPSV